MSTDQSLLRLALSRADHPEVKVLPKDPADGAAKIRKITAIQALYFACRAHYLWGGSHLRVRWIRLMLPELAWAPCWRTTKAATLQPGLA